MPNTNSTTYTILYSLGMAFIVGASLAIVSMALKPYQEKNVKFEKISYIFKTVGFSDFNKKNADAVFHEKVKEFVGKHDGTILEEGYGTAFKVDVGQERKKKPEDRLLPVFVFENSKYIVPCYGVGLWGPIWGYIAFEEDLTTIAGVVFDHKSETPGLGAKITEQEFQAKFVGRKAFDEAGQFVLRVVKAGRAKSDNEIDGISGATLTTNGVDEMLREWLPLYRPLLQKIKQEKIKKVQA